LAAPVPLYVDVAPSFAERIEIDLAKLRQDNRILKLACRRIAGAGKCQRTRVSLGKRVSPTFGYDRT
jgi:hypothetical protein